MLIKTPGTTTHAVFEEAVCFAADEYNTPVEISECCNEIRRSTGCTKYDEEYLICYGDKDIKIDKNAINYCT